MSRLIAAPGETSGLDWRRHRAGSLRSLNTVAVGLGLRLLEELAAGRRGTSAWVRVEFEANGLPHLEVRDSRRREQCPLCRYGGWGDDVISRCVPELVSATAWEQTDGRAKDEFDDPSIRFRRRPSFSKVSATLKNQRKEKRRCLITTTKSWATS